MESAGSLFAPLQVLDAFGRLVPPGATVQPIKGSEFEKIKPGPANPPGYYGPAGNARALNLIGTDTVLKPLTDLPKTASRTGYHVAQAIEIKPWLLAAALAVFLVDMIAVLLLARGAKAFAFGARASVILLATALVTGAGAPSLLGSGEKRRRRQAGAGGIP